MLLPRLRLPASKTSDAAHSIARTTLCSSTSQHLEINRQFSNWLESNWHRRCYHSAKLQSQTFSSSLFLFWRHAVWEWLARAESWPSKKKMHDRGRRPTSGNQEVDWGTPWNTRTKFKSLEGASELGKYRWRVWKTSRGARAMSLQGEAGFA